MIKIKITIAKQENDKNLHIKIFEKAPKLQMLKMQERDQEIITTIG